MSQTEEEPELRDLVTEALEKSGVLAAVRAHLRAGVFLALEREHEQKCGHHLQQLFSTRDGRLALLLVHELLEFCRLRHTASVYAAETGQPNAYVYKGRDALIYDLQLADFTEKTHLPILVQLVSILLKFSKNNTSTSQATVKNQDSNTLANSPDNYDTTFTSDSVTEGVTENKNKTITDDVDKSSPDRVEDDTSEQSYNVDAQIELHTDSDKSLPDSDSKQNNSNENSRESLDDIFDGLHFSTSTQTSSDISKSESIRDGDSGEHNSKSHESDASDESISEEIIQNDKAESEPSEKSPNSSNKSNLHSDIQNNGNGTLKKNANLPAVNTYDKISKNRVLPSYKNSKVSLEVDLSSARTEESKNVNGSN